MKEWKVFETDFGKIEIAHCMIDNGYDLYEGIELYEEDKSYHKCSNEGDNYINLDSITIDELNYWLSQNVFF